MSTTQDQNITALPPNPDSPPRDSLYIIIWLWNDASSNAVQQRYFHWGLALSGNVIFPHMFTTDISQHPVPAPYDTIYRIKNRGPLNPFLNAPLLFEKEFYPIPADRVNLSSLLRLRIAHIADRRRFETLLFNSRLFLGADAGPLGSRKWVFHVLAEAARAGGMLRTDLRLADADVHTILINTMERVLDVKLEEHRYVQTTDPALMAAREKIPTWDAMRDVEITP